MIRMLSDILNQLFDIFLKKERDDEWESQTKLQNWNDIVYTRKDVDIDDPVQRREPDLRGGANKLSLYEAIAAYRDGEAHED